MEIEPDPIHVLRSVQEAGCNESTKAVSKPREKLQDIDCFFFVSRSRDASRADQSPRETRRCVRL